MTDFRNHIAILLILWSPCATAASDLVVVEPPTAVAAARDLLQRVLPQCVDHFEFDKIQPEAGRDVFEIDWRDNKVVIRGNNGVAMASGLNWYLKYYYQELQDYAFPAVFVDADFHGGGTNNVGHYVSARYVVQDGILLSGTGFLTERSDERKDGQKDENRIQLDVILAF